MKRLILLVLCLGALWLGGLVYFAGQIPDSVADPDSQTDAIVVLTGGSQRIETGLQLLAAGKAKMMFVSGVHNGLEVPELLRTLGADEKLADKIVLGHEATDTRSNALETAGWMRAQGFHSMRLVTSAYHMPRSLLEFARAMPDITITPHPVFADNVKQGEWWAWPGTASLIADEYVKYLVVALRLSLPASAAQ
jgi:uncharacterized SAM-binding protein YcdF (DUF218 family)